ncbi:hypothetical protein D3C72_1478590 [compost metagenome]
MPSTMPMLVPVNAYAPARAACCGGYRAAAATMASEKYTGWNKAGTMRSASSSSKRGAYAETTLASANTSRDAISTRLRRQRVASNTRKGPPTAITRANRLTSEPACAAVTP